MTDQERARERAIGLAAEIFGVTLDHITEAPKWCGDGYDGACSRDDCYIVGVVPIITAALLEARKEERERAALCAYNELVGLPDCQRRVARAIRKLKEE